MSEHVPSYRVLENGQVLTDLEPNVWTHYDSEYYVRLAADKATIAADGEDEAVVAVELRNYLNELKEVDVVVTVEMNGHAQEVELVEGTGSFVFASGEPGVFKFVAKYDIARHGEIVIEAVSA